MNVSRARDEGPEGGCEGVGGRPPGGKGQGRGMKAARVVVDFYGKKVAIAEIPESLIICEAKLV